MADFYVDVVNGLSANSGATPALAKQYISEATFANNNRVFLKCGQTHPISTYRFFNHGMTLSSYGTGPLPVLQKTAGSDAWLYIQNVDGVTIENLIFDLAGYNGAGISIKPTTAPHFGHRLSNIEVFGSGNHSGIYIEGTLTAPVTDVIVKNCIAHSNAYHGMLCVGEVKGVLFTGCTAYGNGFGSPAHGFSTYSDTASPHVSGVTFHNCTAYNTIDQNGGEGQGFQFDNNTTDCSFIGCLSYDNEGGGFVFNVGSGNRMIGCVAYNNYKPGLICNETTGMLVANNTFIGNCRSTPYTAEIVLQTTCTGATIRNNILTGSGTLNPTGISLDAGSASGSTAATNCIYGFTTAASGITPTGTVTGNPLLGDGYKPLAGSPCIGTGTATVQLSDLYGKEFKATPSIGAVEAQSERIPATRTIASRRSR